MHKLKMTKEVSDYLFQNLPGGYHRCAMDEGYSFLFVSDRFLDLLGWTKEEIETKFDNKFINLMHPEDKQLTNNYVDKILNKSLDAPYEEAIYRLQCKDGYHWFSDATMKATVNGESFFQGFITDINSFILEKEREYDLVLEYKEKLEKKNTGTGKTSDNRKRVFRNSSGSKKRLRSDFCTGFGNGYLLPHSVKQ